MAFLKYAKAKIQTPGIVFGQWDAMRRGAVSPSPDFQKRTAKVILQEYDPKRYLLTHATIVASVDVDQAPHPLGRHFVDGFEVDRRWANYYITPKTAQFINNNNDSFSRKLLLSSFKSFIGAQNYLEHIQIPEMSKGRIIDAAARDIGDSIFVDILIATDLKHASLVNAIKTGQLGTLSMGCSCQHTSCTRCGNVAEDETQLCSHVRFFKGSMFSDENGVQRKVCELVGHESDPNSCRFIEASWVANPAFKGAVLRSILTPQEVAAVEQKVQMAFPTELPLVDHSQLKAARIHLGQDEFPGASDLPGTDGGEQAPKEEEDGISKAVKDLADALRTQAIEKVRDEINKGEAAKVKDIVDENKQNESLVKSAMRVPQWRRIAKAVIGFVGPVQAKRVLHGLLLHKQGGWSRVRKAGFSGREILAVSRVLDRLTRRTAMAGEARVYRAVLSVGGTAPYEDVETYLAACRQVIGRRVTGSEASQLLEKGRLYSLGRSK